MAAKTMFTAVLLATLSLFSQSSCTSTSSKSIRSYVVHERRESTEAILWSKHKRMPRDEAIDIHIALAQRNNRLGEHLLMQVSDPQSPNYGRHWSSQQITEIFSPSNATVEATVSWITTTLGIDKDRLSLSAGNGWLNFRTTVVEAEALFETEYWIYEHGSRAQFAAGADHYSVPENLQGHIDFVYPGVMLGERFLKSPSGVGRSERETMGRKRIPRQTSTNETCADLVTPQCIKELYGLPTADKVHANNSLGIFQRISWYQNQDLDIFLENYAPDIPQGARPRNLSIDLAEWFYDDPDDQYTTVAIEADLDIEVAWPIIYPQNITIYQVDDIYYNLYASTTGLFNTFLDAIDGSYCNSSAYGETGDNSQYDPLYPDYHEVTASDGSSYDPGTYKSSRLCGVYKPTNVISISYSRAETSFTAAYQKRQCDELRPLSLSMRAGVDPG